MATTISIKTRARRIGLLYFVFLILGLIDLHAFSHFIVPGDATATAINVRSAQLTFRVGILTDFVTLVVFIFLVVSLYRLFKSVDNWQAILMLLLVSIGVAIGLTNLLNKIAPLELLHDDAYLSVFSKPQLDALVLMFLKLNSGGDILAAVFWGLWLFPFGILVIKSGYFPRFLGILLLVAGFGYVVSSITHIVLPAHTHLISLIAIPFLLGEFPIIFWLLIMGAKVANQQMAPPHAN